MANRLERLQRKAARRGLALREAPDGEGFEMMAVEDVDEYMRTGKITTGGEDFTHVLRHVLPTLDDVAGLLSELRRM